MLDAFHRKTKLSICVRMVCCFVRVGIEQHCAAMLTKSVWSQQESRLSINSSRGQREKGQVRSLTPRQEVYVLASLFILISGIQ